MAQPTDPSKALVLSQANRGLGARADFVGLRADKQLVFRCACGCGGHVLVDRLKMEQLEAYRQDFTSRAKARRLAPCFGGSVYVTGHEPIGILAASVRTGERTHLHASA